MTSDNARTRTRPIDVDAADEQRLRHGPEGAEAAIADVPPAPVDATPPSPLTPAERARVGPARLPGRGYAASRAALLLRMQQTEGNRAVQRLLGRPRLPAAGDNLAGRLEAARSSGRPLEPDVQAQLEQGLGADLSAVRVHTDTEADSLARDADARAFTTEQHIFFRSDAYDPDSREGTRLLAHEAAHTLQQRAGPVAGTPMAGGVAVSDPGDAFERAAPRAGAAVAALGGAAGAPARSAPGDALERVIEAATPMAATASPRVPALGAHETVAVQRARLNEDDETVEDAPNVRLGADAVHTAPTSSGEGSAALQRPPAEAAASPVAPPGQGGSEHPLVTRVNEAYSFLAADAEGPMAGTLGPSGGGPSGVRGRALSQAMGRDREALNKPSPRELDGLKDELIQEFQNRAVALAITWLDRNEQIALAERGRYGEVSSGDPATQANRVRQAARDLGAVQQAILRLLQERTSAAMGNTGPQGQMTADRFDTLMEDSPVAQGNEVIQGSLLPRLEGLKRIYGPSFPILLQRNCDYMAIAEADAPELQQIVAVSTGSVLESIRTARADLTPRKIWSLPPIIEATKQDMGIPLNASTAAGHALDAYQSSVEAEQAFTQIALAALGITLAIGATIATAGAAGPPALGAAAGTGTAGTGTAAALTLMSAGLSAYGAVEEYTEYQFTHAAAGASLDPATALSREDPSLGWLAMAIAGAVLDVGGAVVAFRNLAAAARAVRTAEGLRALEEAARAQARVLSQEGRLGELAEDQFVERIMQARTRSKGTAGEELLGEDIDDLAAFGRPANDNIEVEPLRPAPSQIAPASAEEETMEEALAATGTGTRFPARRGTGLTGDEDALTRASGSKRQGPKEPRLGSIKITEEPRSGAVDLDIESSAQGATSGAARTGTIRQEVLSRLSEEMEYVSNNIITELGENANIESIGLQGSTSRGTVGNVNKETHGQEWNPFDFDLDLFIVSDDLHARVGGKGWLWADSIPEILAEQENLYNILKSDPIFKGMRPGKDGLRFKVFKSSQARQIIKDAIYFYKK